MRHQNSIKFETKHFDFIVAPYDSKPTEFPKTYSKIRYKPKGTPVSWWTELTPETATALAIDALGQRILGIV